MNFSQNPDINTIHPLLSRTGFYCIFLVPADA